MSLSKGTLVAGAMGVKAVTLGMWLHLGVRAVTLVTLRMRGRVPAVALDVVVMAAAGKNYYASTLLLHYCYDDYWKLLYWGAMAVTLRMV